MTWEDKISYISIKLPKSVSMLQRVKWTIDSLALRLLFNTLALAFIISFTSCYATLCGNTYCTNFCGANCRKASMKDNLIQVVQLAN